jgi:glycosyltransferase involved in cell wall biosynthesis
MKIAHVISYFQPQIGYQEYYLAKVQQKEGHEVTVVTSDRYWRYPNYEQSYKKILGDRIVGSGEFVESKLRVIRHQIIFEYAPLLMLRRLKQTLLMLSPDLIIGHGLEFPLAWQIAGIKMKHLKNARLIFDSHVGSYDKNRDLNQGHDYKRELYALVWRLLFKRLLLKASPKVVAVTEDGKKAFINNFKIPEDAIVVIPLGVDPDLFIKDQRMREKIRSEYGIAENEIVGIYSGKISSLKGITELLDALRDLFNEFKSFKFIFIGFPTERELVNKIKSLSPKKCFYASPVEASILSHYYSAADFAIWPRSITASHYEAMSCELPIIVSDLKACKERVRWNNGYFLNAVSADEISSKIKLLLNHPQRIKQMGQNGRNAIVDHLSWAALNREFLRIYY